MFLCEFSYNFINLEFTYSIKLTNKSVFQMLLQLLAYVIIIIYKQSVAIYSTKVVL